MKWKAPKQQHNGAHAQLMGKQYRQPGIPCKSTRNALEQEAHLDLEQGVHGLFQGLDPADDGAAAGCSTAAALPIDVQLGLQAGQALFQRAHP